MTSNSFSNQSQRYLINVLSDLLTHADISIFENPLGLATDGPGVTKKVRLQQMMAFFFQPGKNTDDYILDLINYAYYEPKNADNRREMPDFNKLDEIVLKPANITLGSSGFYYDRDDAGIRRTDSPDVFKLKMIGEGSYANVYKFKDTNYDLVFGLKRAKKGLSLEELARFEREFTTLKDLNFPYILKVYRYNATKHEYTMEYCDFTLTQYITKLNNDLSFAHRKQLALYFLYGINYLSKRNILHRDISLNNTLIKVYDNDAFSVRISDFGLVKHPNSDLTRTGADLKGTFIDPLLGDFRDYKLSNEIYAVGMVLSYIFTGQKGYEPEGVWAEVLEKCTSKTVNVRYSTILEIIEDVRKLEVTQTYPCNGHR